MMQRVGSFNVYRETRPGWPTIKVWASVLAWPVAAFAAVFVGMSVSIVQIPDGSPVVTLSFATWADVLYTIVAIVILTLEVRVLVVRVRDIWGEKAQRGDVIMVRQ